MSKNSPVDKPGLHQANYEKDDDNRTQQQKPTDLHVITENGEQCFMWRSNQLSYIAQDRHELPYVLANKFGLLATKLDLSYNSLKSFKNINLFSKLNELILDNNELEDDHLDFKQNLRLKTLSLNKNKLSIDLLEQLSDLHRLVSTIKVCFPNLEFLSLLGNPLCPASILPSDMSADHKNPTEAKFHSSTTVVVDGRHIFNTCSSSDPSCNLALNSKQTEFSYQKYRYFIIYHLPNLRFLDSSPISSIESDEALRRFYWMDNSARQQQSIERTCDVQDLRPNNTNSDYNDGRPASEPTTELRQIDSQEAGFQLTIITNHSDESAESYAASALAGRQPSKAKRHQETHGTN